MKLPSAAEAALIAIILGVDRILDMRRTVINMTGNLTVAIYVARSEGFKLLIDYTKSIRPLSLGQRLG